MRALHPEMHANRMAAEEENTEMKDTYFLAKVSSFWTHSPHTGYKTWAGYFCSFFCI